MSPDMHLRKILLYDPARRPRDWTACLTESEVAIFISDVKTGEELDADGKLVSPEAAGHCYIARNSEQAEGFCRTLTQESPRAKCEIFDQRGRVVEPLAIFVHPSLEKKEKEDSPRRARLLIAAGMLSISLAVPLFYFDWTRSGHLIWPSLLAVNCFGLGLRLLFWGNGIVQRRRKNKSGRAESAKAGR